ncbi:4512_t:CDS:1 [Ambispora leptoticha]|uniref:4512_t:CDS:1 n=1 Tax=Ambispora leptoticha TaxID=144679 RepID=A0A9N9N6W0_9GLOM|nr:4512_t:CDS:1 [Ambispora leptoticha]
MSTNSGNVSTKPTRVKKRVQRTAYKTSEKLVIILKPKNLAFWQQRVVLVLTSRWCHGGCQMRKILISKNRRVGAGRIAAYPAAEEVIVNWIHKLRLIGIAITSAAIKMK